MTDEKRCKKCGACKECGAAPPQFVPSPYPVYPYQPVVPPWPYYQVTCGTTAAPSAWNMSANVSYQ